MISFRASLLEFQAFHFIFHAITFPVLPFQVLLSACFFAFYYDYSQQDLDEAPSGHGHDDVTPISSASSSHFGTSSFGWGPEPPRRAGSHSHSASCNGGGGGPPWPLQDDDEPMSPVDIQCNLRILQRRLSAVMDKHIPLEHVIK